MPTDRWTFTMVTPDAVVGGYLDFVLDRLRAYDLTVRACRLLELDYQRLGRMYAHRDDPPGYGGRRIELPPWVMTPLYAIAPAVVIVVEGDCARMLECKGKTRPEHAAPGTLRAAGENYVFNLVHCPDDAESARIELGYLVGAEDAAGLQRIATGQAGADDLVGVELLRLCLPAFSGWETLSFPVTANRLRCRVVQKLAVTRTGEPLEALRRARTALQEERARLIAEPSVPARFEIGRAADASIATVLATAAAGDATLASGLTALSRLHDLDGERDVPAIRSLAGAGIYLSEMEKVTLDAHAYTHWT
jgi:nucleoside diphosphate kinase